MDTKTTNHGGKRPGAGRKPKTTEEQLRADFDAAWPQDRRRKAIEAASERASQGDIGALKVLMAYAYGTPPSGDEIRIQEAVDNEVETLLTVIEQNVSPDTWREIEAALRI